MEYQAAVHHKLILPSLSTQGWAKEQAIKTYPADSNSVLNSQMVQALMQLGAQSPTFSGFSDIKQPQIIRNMLSSSPKLEGASVRSRSPKASVSPGRRQSRAHVPFMGKRTPLAAECESRAFESYPWESQALDGYPTRPKPQVAASPLMFEQPTLSRHKSEHPDEGFYSRPAPGGRKRELIIRVSLDDAEDCNHPLRPLQSPFETPIGALLRYATTTIMPGRLEDRRPFGDHPNKRRPAATQGFEPYPTNEYIRHCIAKEQKFNKRVQNIETYFDERKDGLLKLLDGL